MAATVALVAVACTTGGGTTSPSTTVTGQTTAEAVPAPAFPDGLDWLNVDRPLSLDDLRGKVVLLDFWTYGCINCIHIIPDLKQLEAEFPEELVVIGVHSAKFANEGDTENIRQVIQRYDISHPVINDAGFDVWDAWGARAWPTVAVVDPAGNVVGIHEGEGVYDVVEPVIADLVARFSATGDLDPTPLPIRLERDRSPSTVLSYPGKVFADPDSDRIFISDTGHHRIIAASDDGLVTAVFGSGVAGFDDGIGLTASFSSPQGLALDGNTLYVADTNNHAVRRVNLDSGAVTTLAGTGVRGWPPVGGTLDEVSLNSPWALELDGTLLHVANAGTHQIWTIDLIGGTAEPSVGSSREGTTNGPLLEAALAQPSGLALGADGMLYFADSESSSIRSAAIGAAGAETALVAGGSSNLFDFGDQDGTGEEARFQHPLGVAYHDGLLFVADTYNSKIKTVDPSTGDTATLYGTDHGWRDGMDPLFYEPGGLSVDGDTLWVADTNNNAVRRLDLTNGVAETLVLSGLDRFVDTSVGDDFHGRAITLPQVAAGAGPASIVLDVVLPDGYKVNADASSSLLLAEEGTVASFPSGSRVDLTGTTFPVTVPIDLHPGVGSVIADLALVWCKDDAEGLCLFEQTRFVVPVNISPTGPSALIHLPLTLKSPAG